MPHDPAIPLLDIYPEKMIIWKDTCTSMFTAALSTTAKMWKQPKYLLTDEWIMKMWGVCVCIKYEYYSAIIKKNEILPFAATWMDLEIIKWSKSDRERQIYDTTYMWNLKKWYKWAYLQNRNKLIDTESKLMVTKRERGWGRDKLGVWE